MLASSFAQAHSSASALTVLPFLGAGLGGAPIPRRWPRRCSHSSASAWAVLPFLGVRLGGAPIPRPRQCSHSSASALAMLPFLGVGLGNAPISRRRPHPWWFLGVGLRGAPIPRCRPRQCSPSSSASPSVVDLLDSSASPRCSSSASPRCSARKLRPRLGAPHETIGLASVVLLLGSLPSPRCSAQNLRPCLRGAPPRFLCISFAGTFRAYC
jgi:hypothetical protein